MDKNKFGLDLEKKIIELVEQCLESDSLFLVDVEIKGNSGNQKIQVFIDGDTMVGIDEYSRVSRKLSELIEERELIDGRYISSSEDDQLTKVYHYNKGLLDGEFLVYNLEGDLVEKGNYHDGQKHGKWMTWGLKGIKTSEVHFNYGQRDGKWQIHDSKGTLRYVMFYDIGEKVGVWKVFDEKGALQEERKLTRTI